MKKFRRSGSSLAELSSGALLLGRATNAWAMGTSTGDVLTLSTLGRVVQISSAADALQLGWSGPTEDFGYEGYYIGDRCYRHIGHQQDSETGKLDGPNPKPDGLVSQEVAATLDHRHEKEALKDGPSADQPESSQGRIGLRRESSANGEVRADTEKSIEEVAAEKNMDLEVKAETRTEVETNS
jgi:hypothetical protein